MLVRWRFEWAKSFEDGFAGVGPKPASDDLIDFLFGEVAFDEDKSAARGRGYKKWRVLRVRGRLYSVLSCTRFVYFWTGSEGNREISRQSPGGHASSPDAGMTGGKG